MGISALNASLGLLLDIGIEKIQAKVIDNTEYLLNQLASRADINIVSAVKPGSYAGIVSFVMNHVDNEKLYQYLMANNVICANRGGGIRFSPHFYTEQKAIDKALKLVDSYTE
ncbi:MAG: aminotransferase class V-fold PLP-dependent enzyme, partial [Gammaproteobacteria bacterium]|nr:aminotransferase class V-fold PLP-dependent enzyme [Gammaproteobacteria bacterium]